MAKKRTQKEIQSDCKRIQKAAKTASTFSEIEKITGLTYQRIMTSLEEHPIILKRIKDLLSNNRKLKSEHGSKRTGQKKKIVIDASIVATLGLKETMEKIIGSEKKIILTQITIRELQKMQSGNDLSALDSRYLLRLAVENPDDFETIQINERLSTPDNCIIEYCKENKGNTTLYTSDKEMVLIARTYGIEVIYLPKLNPTSKYSNYRLKTLYDLIWSKGKLILTEFNTPSKSISLYSNGVEYSEGVKEVKIGDELFIATKKYGFTTFAHYQITHLRKENHCKLIFSRRIYGNQKIELPKITYKKFLNDFRIRHDA